MVTADELLLKIKADSSQAQRELSGFADKAESSAKRAGRAMQDAGKKMTTRLTLPLIGAGAAAVKLFTTQEDATRKLQSTFDSTGAAAWTSVEALQANADALQQITTHGDEAIEEMQSVLLTFTQIKGTNFDTATKSILNMSDALNMDLQSSAVMVGKALNDPIAGISAMSRAGITFSEEQKEMIKTMAESGDVAGAQAVMLAELETQFGGTAEAMAETSSGQMKQAMNTLGDSMETVGAIIVPILVKITDFIGKLATAFDNLPGPAQKAIIGFLGIVAAVGPVLLVVGKVVTMIQTGGPLVKGIKATGTAIKWLTTSAMGPWVIAIAAVIAAAILIIKNWDTIKKFLLKTWEAIKKVWDATLAALQKVWDTIWNAIKLVLTTVIDAIVWYVTTYINIIKTTIETVINAIQVVWTTVWGAIRAVFEGIWDVITGAVETATETIKTVISGTIETVQGWWESFTGALSAAWGLVWDTLSDGVETALMGAWNVVKGVVNTFLGGLETAINNVIGLLNAAIKGYNKIPLAPNVPTIPTVSVPRLAEGGITAANMFKAGERGPELVSITGGKATVQPITEGDGIAAGVNVTIERMEGGDPIAVAEEIGWEFVRRGAA